MKNFKGPAKTNGRKEYNKQITEDEAAQAITDEINIRAVLFRVDIYLQNKINSSIRRTEKTLKCHSISIK